MDICEDIYQTGDGDISEISISSSVIWNLASYLSMRDYMKATMEKEISFICIENGAKFWNRNKFSPFLYKSS